MEAKAKLNHVRVTPSKMRRVVNLVRGQQVDEARRILQFSALGSTDKVAKLLNSAVANAEQQPGIVGGNLYVKAVWVDEGPTLKRFRPRAQGRATQILKRTSHVTLVVAPIGED